MSSICVRIVLFNFKRNLCQVSIANHSKCNLACCSWIRLRCCSTLLIGIKYKSRNLKSIVATRPSAPSAPADITRSHSDSSYSHHTTSKSPLPLAICWDNLQLHLHTLCPCLRGTRAGTGQSRSGQKHTRHTWLRPEPESAWTSSVRASCSLVRQHQPSDPAQTLALAAQLLMPSRYTPPLGWLYRYHTRDAAVHKCGHANHEHHSFWRSKVWWT